MFENVEFFQLSTGLPLRTQGNDILLRDQRAPIGRVQVAKLAGDESHLVAVNGKVIFVLDREPDALEMFNCLTGDFPTDLPSLYQFLLEWIYMGNDEMCHDKEYPIGMLMHLYAHHILAGRGRM